MSMAWELRENEKRRDGRESKEKWDEAIERGDDIGCIGDAKRRKRVGRWDCLKLWLQWLDAWRLMLGATLGATRVKRQVTICVATMKKNLVSRFVSRRLVCVCTTHRDAKQLATMKFVGVTKFGNKWTFMRIIVIIEIKMKEIYFLIWKNLKKN